MLERLLAWRSRRRDERDGAAAPPERLGGGRTRVLVEYPLARTPTVVADVLDRAGYEVAICDGPGTRPGACTLLRTGACALAEDADVVLNGFGLSRSGHRAIVSALRSTYPDTPLLVEVAPPRAEEHAELLDGCRRCHVGLTSTGLIEAVTEAARA